MLILNVWNRFKGTDTTFGEFPQRLQHVLTETLDNTDVESVIFPAYEVHILRTLCMNCDNLFEIFRPKENWYVCIHQ